MTNWEDISPSVQAVADRIINEVARLRFLRMGDPRVPLARGLVEVIEEERTQCAEAICDLCNDGQSAFFDYTNGGWHHRVNIPEDEDYSPVETCLAGPIWARRQLASKR